MNGKDIINLQEAYLQVYSQPEISEEAEIAAEYFYEQGLNEEDVEDLIEELGVEEFNELVYEILESYGITEISEASAAQNWIARQILQGMERHKQATQKLGQSKAGKALGSVERGLTTVGDLGFRAAGKAKQAVEKEIEKKKGEQKGRYRGKGLGRRETVSSGGTSTTSGPSSSGRMQPPAKYGKPEPSGQGTLFDTPPEGKLSKPLSKVTAPKPPKTKRETGKYRQVPMRFPKTQKEDFELWVNTLLDEGYDLSDYTWDDMMEIYEANVVMSVTSPSGKERSVSRLRSGQETPEQIRNRRFSQTLADREKERKSKMNAGRLTVATKRGIERATNRSERGENDWVNVPLNPPKAKPSKSLKGSERQKAFRDIRQKKVDTELKDPKKVKQFRRRHGLPEEFELILSHLLDEGYAETLESAEAILNSMSEEWVSEILDEAHQIMSVSRGGKQIYKTPRSELHRPSNEPSSHKQKRMKQLARARRNADRRGEDSPARERQFDRFVSGTDTPLNRIRTSNIKKLNAPEEPDYNYDPYRTVRTDYAARRRRASGR